MLILTDDAHQQNHVDEHVFLLSKTTPNTFDEYNECETTRK